MTLVHPSIWNFRGIFGPPVGPSPEARKIADTSAEKDHFEVAQQLAKNVLANQPDFFPKCNQQNFPIA